MPEGKPIDIQTSDTCFHCGDSCANDSVRLNDKVFCCTGCRTVYEILQENQLQCYYDFNKNPGSSFKKIYSGKFDYLDDPDVIAKLISFSDGKTASVTFFIRQMHCSSCIWLLENLFKFNAGILNSQVNFLQKKLSLRYSEDHTTLRKVVELLASVGYAPEINLNDLDGKPEESTVPRDLYYKIGISGFAFGNIMLLSFPEYLSFINNVDPFLKIVFGYIIIALSLPVFFYCSADYFASAWKALKRKVINIDFPLSLGIVVLFGQSLYDIMSGAGPGYMDSFAGLLFFLLTGRLFQAKTYETLNFERNYKSYFPVAVTVKNKNNSTTVPASKIKPGDRLIIRNGELIPADSVLIKGKGFIDYSFVTGESKPLEKLQGELIYAGGRQAGPVIELEVIKEVSQSYLTQLWNQDISKENENSMVSLSNTISKYFTFAILLIASAAFLFHLPSDTAIAFNAFTAVLIIACPCALALSTPFTFGNTLRIFGRNRFYLKNISVIEKLASVSAIVFDKTGTITKSGKTEISFDGEKLSPAEEMMVRSVAVNSAHPLSMRISNIYNSVNTGEVESFREIPGAGLEGIVDGHAIKLGSRSFISVGSGPADTNFKKSFDTSVYLSINNCLKGIFRVSNSYREGLDKVISSLHKYKLYLLSGDNEGEKQNLLQYFRQEPNLRFRQTPEDKLNFIRDLQEKGERVLMIGDGLNDAGALMKSDVGISVSEDTANFSPACDAILDASVFNRLHGFLKFSELNLNIIKASFLISLVYNIAGLSFAVRGVLSPVIAAILMPLSSITVVLFTTAATNLYARKKGMI